jgi:hypothetical protein
MSRFFQLRATLDDDPLAFFQCDGYSLSAETVFDSYADDREAGRDHVWSFAKARARRSSRSQTTIAWCVLDLRRSSLQGSERAMVNSAMRHVIVGALVAAGLFVPASVRGDASAECKARTTELGARLATMTDSQIGTFPLARRLIRRASAGRIEQGGALISVDAHGGTTLYGDTKNKDALATQLELWIVALNERERAQFTDMLYIAVEAGTPAQAVASTLAVARAAGIRGQARLLVALPASAAKSDDALVARPTVAALRKKLAGASDHEAYAVALSDAVRSAVKPCAAALTVWASPSPSVVLTKLAPAVLQCDCSMADFDLFEFAVLTTFGVFEGPKGWIAMPELKTDDKRTMEQVLTALR